MRWREILKAIIYIRTMLGFWGAYVAQHGLVVFPICGDQQLSLICFWLCRRGVLPHTQASSGQVRDVAVKMRRRRDSHTDSLTSSWVLNYWERHRFGPSTFFRHIKVWHDQMAWPNQADLIDQSATHSDNRQQSTAVVNCDHVTWRNQWHRFYSVARIQRLWWV